MHTKLPWHTKSGLGDWMIVDSSRRFVIAELGFAPGFAENGKMSNEKANAEFIVKAVNNHDQLVSTLRLIQSGLRNGSVKSNPILSFSDDAASVGIQSLSTVVDAALAKVTP